ncbi:MAG: hypothetical protein LC753_07315 [Acidobacteria bacterium]|nr:hypothetical protein [Acidobacteriota bacterium]
MLFGPDASLYVVDWGAAQQALRPSGPVVVASVGLDEDQQKPMVPNVPETYAMARNTLALLIGGLILLIALAVWGWRRMRRT